MLPMEQALIFLVIFTFWVIRLYYKLYDAKIRKYVMVIGILIVFWMLIRIFKGLTSEGDVNRMFWYFYYIPLIFIPSFFYICVFTLLGGITNMSKKVIYIISGILLVLIFTNDFHQLVFRFPYGIDNYNNYSHFFGYYLTCIWIFYLFGRGMIMLAINKIKKGKNFKAFMPLILLIGGILYTCFYVMDVPFFRTSNLSVILSVLICLGIELILYLELIPNNSKYKKTFENSHLDMAIISLDSSTMYNTKSLRELPNYIYSDIKDGVVKENYREKDIIYDIKFNGDSYVCFKKDIYELNVLSDKLKLIEKELLLRQKKLKSEEAIKKELYEIKLREEIVFSLERSLEDKKFLINEILSKDDLIYDDVERIKLLVSYCKRKSSLIISQLNNDMYNDALVKAILKELFIDSRFLGISGEVVLPFMNFSSYMMSLVYDIVFNIIENISDTYIMVFICCDDAFLKVNLGIKSSLKDRLKYDKNVICVEKIYDDDIELIFSMKGDNLLWK